MLTTTQSLKLKSRINNAEYGLSLLKDALRARAADPGPEGIMDMVRAVRDMQDTLDSMTDWVGDYTDDND